MSERRPPERALWLGAVAAVVVGLGAAFYLPALGRTHGHFPVPLDDVYIHFDYARQMARLRPFEWSPGNGYSSGATSLLYPVALAPAFWLGLGAYVGYYAAALACVALWDLTRSLRALLGRGPLWLVWAAPLLLLCVPLLSWSWYSGMETALLGAMLGRSLVAAKRAMEAPPAARAGAQLRLGALAALMVATRPETVGLSLGLGVAATYSARSLTTLGSLGRTIAPTFAFLGAQAALNLALTGEASAAGGVRKLLWNNPYATGLDVTTTALTNLIVLKTQAVDAALGPLGWATALLGLVAVIERRTRRLAIPLWIGGVGSLLLVSLNNTARYQNYRYAAPTLVTLLIAAALGALALCKRGRVGQVIAALGLVAAILSPLGGWPQQLEHFAQASRNIAEQQVVVGEKLAKMSPPPRRVFVGDAGAIPFFSELPALDGLGLGGYHRLPFARASVQGNAAIVELIERMPERERPDVLAIYPSWFPDLAASFGRRVDAVSIEHNVICGASEKVIYAADWSSLDRPGPLRAGAVDELDVADLVSEREHGYVFTTPQNGWVIGMTRNDETGRGRFEGGRILGEGTRESFTLRREVARGPHILSLRTDGQSAATLTITVERDSKPIESVAAQAEVTPAGAWVDLSVPLADVGGSDRVTIHVARGSWRSFHMFVVRPGAEHGL